MIPADGALTKARELEGDHPIVLGVGGGGIRGGSEFGVLSDQVLFRDPTGTGTEASD